jgi:hypothetical protein
MVEYDICSYHDDFPFSFSVIIQVKNQSLFPQCFPICFPTQKVGKHLAKFLWKTCHKYGLIRLPLIFQNALIMGINKGDSSIHSLLPLAFFVIPAGFT